jgi:hypothetical protein
MGIGMLQVFVFKRNDNIPRIFVNQETRNKNFNF